MAESDLLAGVHPEVAHLSWLVGRWRGIGEGDFPGTGRFRYEEIVEFATDGRPFLEYRAVSWILDDDNARVRPSHTENGYWRPTADNGVEAVICNPMGIAELWLGAVTVTSIENARITGARLEVHTTKFVRTPTAPAVHDGTRIYGLVQGELLMAFDLNTSADAAPSSHVWNRMQRV